MNVMPGTMVFLPLLRTSKKPVRLSTEIYGYGSENDPYAHQQQLVQSHFIHAVSDISAVSSRAPPPAAVGVKP